MNNIDTDVIKYSITSENELSGLWLGNVEVSRGGREVEEEIGRNIENPYSISEWQDSMMFASYIFLCS